MEGAIVGMYFYGVCAPKHRNLAHTSQNNHWLSGR